MNSFVPWRMEPCHKYGQELVEIASRDDVCRMRPCGLWAAGGGGLKRLSVEASANGVSFAMADIIGDRKAIAREIAARTKPRFIEIPRESGRQFHSRTRS